MGFIDSAYIVAFQPSLFGAVPKDGPRPAFFAVANISSLGTYAVGAMIAEPIVRMLRDVSVTLGPFQLGQYQCFYTICALLMIPASFGALLLKPVQRSKTTNKQLNISD